MVQCRQNTYLANHPASCAPASSASTLFGMDINLPQLPRHFGHAAMEPFLRKLLRNQEIFATDFWELFNSLGYRIDKQIVDMCRSNDRLWKLEHPQRRGCEENQTEGISVFDNRGPSRSGSEPGTERHQGPARREHERSVGAPGGARKDAAGRSGKRRGREVTPAGERLLERARARFGVVFPCAGRNWEGCLIEERGMIMFWFDTPDKNTHMLYEREALERVPR